MMLKSWCDLNSIMCGYCLTIFLFIVSCDNVILSPVQINDSQRNCLNPATGCEIITRLFCGRITRLFCKIRTRFVLNAEFSHHYKEQQCEAVWGGCTEKKRDNLKKNDKLMISLCFLATDEKQNINAVMFFTSYIVMITPFKISTYNVKH